MRGSASDTSRSTNSHIQAPRSVTFAPIAMPSRSLKPAIDFRAFVTGLLPGDDREVLERGVQEAAVLDGFPDAHVDHDLLQAGDLHHVRQSELVLQGRDDLVPIARPETRRVPVLALM